jgi:hypothetical protein
MKVIKDTLEPLMETWDDPGDYPNALAAGPLPSYNYFAGVDGDIILELTAEELADYAECPEDFLDNMDIEMPDGVRWIKWRQDSLEGSLLTLSVDEAEPDPDFGVREPDYDDSREDY